MLHMLMQNLNSEIFKWKSSFFIFKLKCFPKSTKICFSLPSYKSLQKSTKTATRQNILWHTYRNRSWIFRPMKHNNEGLPIHLINPLEALNELMDSRCSHSCFNDTQTSLLFGSHSLFTILNDHNGSSLN